MNKNTASINMIVIVLMTIIVTNTSCTKNQTDSEEMVLWYNKPADKVWLDGLFIGNGYMGANVFGRTDTERIQLTEKTLFNTGLYGLGGLTSFAEIDIHFNHENVTDYRRSLNLNEAMARVSIVNESWTMEFETISSMVRVSATGSPASNSQTDLLSSSERAATFTPRRTQLGLRTSQFRTSAPKSGETNGW